MGLFKPAWMSDDSNKRKRYCERTKKTEILFNLSLNDDAQWVREACAKRIVNQDVIKQILKNEIKIWEKDKYELYCSDIIKMLVPRIDDKHFLLEYLKSIPYLYDRSNSVCTISKMIADIVQTEEAYCYAICKFSDYTLTQMKDTFEKLIPHINSKQWILYVINHACKGVLRAIIPPNISMFDENQIKEFSQDAREIVTMIRKNQEVARIENYCANGQPHHFGEIQKEWVDRGPRGDDDWVNNGYWAEYKTCKKCAYKTRNI